VQGDLWLVGFGSVQSLRVVVVVVKLHEEQVHAHLVPTDVLLVPVEAKPLAAAHIHLLR
jgi:hypothetical protein